jgi:RNA polymerase sigma-70 factor (ECF subfamily)
MDSEDANCIKRIAQGDQNALADLYTRYRFFLTRSLWNQLSGDSALIEEMLQDTFLAIWRAAATFRGEAQVATWILRIAQHCAGEIQRRMTRDMRFLSSAAIHEESGIAPTADYEQQSLTRLMMHEALLRLTDKQREVITLRFVQGFTTEEMARMLGVPVGTIRARIYAARAALVNDPALQQSEGVNP